ncbi:hypothetical protein [Flavobacterium sp. 7A]|uniref:hypothetical protein n=1 Tax=Flavobacterium sp. 7A TaxID=2940571 RepID=UPI002227DAD5|nr:hypothetical protein [Flavobacterium sp. 7A]MCW2117819.1 tetratricopeptide (TPR) repeat protein [Flavobacterium sp. 7A]
MMKEDPIPKKSALSASQKITIHEAYLKNAIASKNEVHQLYGYFFLFADHYNNSEYLATNDYLLQAEILISKYNRPDWQAAYHIRKALVFDIKSNSKAALKEYLLAYNKAAIAKDSLYMAEILEQISATYGEIDNYPEAEKYFAQAEKMMPKFADKEQIAQAYNNYSNLKCYQNDQKAGLKYIEIAISVIKELKDPYIESMYQNNKAIIWTEMKQYDKAEILFKKLEIQNKNNNWKDRQVQNFLTQAVLYESWGKYQKAIQYYIKHYELKDKIEGNEVNEKMSELEKQFLNEKKENIIKDNQIKLHESERRIILLLLVLSISFIAIATITLLLKKQKKETRYQLKTKIAALNEVTALLIEKNKSVLQEKSDDQFDTTEEQSSETFLNKKILTDADWSIFKTYFENAYPNYIKKVRDNFPKITAGEERLFLCLRLNLKNKEIATILGISNESVKKNRNRLRKKIGLDLDANLNEYILNF